MQHKPFIPDPEQEFECDRCQRTYTMDERADTNEYEADGARGQPPYSSANAHLTAGVVCDDCKDKYCYEPIEGQGWAYYDWIGPFKRADTPDESRLHWQLAQPGRLKLQLEAYNLWLSLCDMLRPVLGYGSTPQARLYAITHAAYLRYKRRTNPVFASPGRAQPIGWQLVETGTDEPYPGHTTSEIMPWEMALDYLQLCADRTRWRMLPVFAGDLKEPVYLGRESDPLPEQETL